MPRPSAASRTTGAAPTVPHPLDEVPQDFEDDATSYEVRDGLGKLVERDLLGPWGDEQESLGERAPGDRYLVGMLGPRADVRSGDDSARLAAEELEGEPGESGDARDSELPEVTTPQAAGRIWPSSMGMSFVVPADVGLLSVTASWGRYARVQETDEEGVTRTVWRREPCAYPVDIDVTAFGQHTPYYLEGDKCGPHIRLDVRMRTRAARAQGAKDLRVVEVALVNALEERTELRDLSWLYQTQLTAHAFPDTSAAVFQPIDDPLCPGAEHAAHEDPEELRLRLLYRDELRHASGRNVAVHAAVRKGERNAYTLTTTWLPVHDVPATTAPAPGTDGLLHGLELGMDRLAELSVPESKEELAAVLRPLTDDYGTWLRQQREQAVAPETGLPDDLRAAAVFAVEEAEEIARRVAAGIEVLGTDPVALECFRFANWVMAHQRRNTDIAALRHSAGGAAPMPYEAARSEVAEKGAAGASWRPFQLAFVLLNIPSLTQPGHPHRGTGREGLVDLLFFPTGGGKTEAYLGLTAYTFALRRLQETEGMEDVEGKDRHRGAGVGVLMRYTLRLLTAQQFQRAASLVCAAEVVRREAYEGKKAGGPDGKDIAPDLRWGSTPFRIGLWVGSKVSPNNFREAAEQVGSARDSADGRHANAVQVTVCPWCGERLRPEQDVADDPLRRRILLYCPRGEGDTACPFSRRKAADEGIPVLTVDEEIYRLLPSLLIATVDKFALLPWYGQAGLLFGRTTQWCPRHGYRHDDLDGRIDCGSWHQARGGEQGRVVSEAVPRLRPPDFLIQDELHLISGALGTTFGLFEAAVDQLCTRKWTDAEGREHRTGPKIIASTATTKRAADQVRGVFGRKVAVFPPQVLTHTDTFFSRQVPLSRHAPGRRYLGVCAHGTRLKSAEIRIAEILLRAGQELFDRHGAPADPYMTLVGYFNATRELAGMRRYLDDDVTTRVRRDQPGPGRRLANRIVTRTGMLTIEELTSRISSRQIGTALDHLQQGFDPERDTSVRRRALAAELAEAAKQKREPRAPYAASAVDVVLATSMLQVGVDVGRFGLMLVVGQPKNTAEYIQASSRVGRAADKPGLVVTLYNWSRPRDLAHYEDFAHYHATFYRQVEALSVTPFTRRSLDRGTAATYVAALRHAAETHSRNTDAHTLDLDGAVAREVEERLLDRAEAAVREGKGEQARSYLAEKLDALKDAWRQSRSGSEVTGYRSETRPDQNVTALLRLAEGSGWDELTVPMSMRETENEINLLLPGGRVATYARGADWDFSRTAEHADDGAPDAQEEEQA